MGRLGEPGSQVELTARGEALEPGKKRGAEAGGQKTDRQREALPRSPPTPTLQTKAAAGDHEVDMWMVAQRLTPRVKDTQRPDGSPKMSGLPRRTRSPDLEGG